MDRKTYYLGFTSNDCCKSKNVKNYSLYLHLAGGSNFKGTHSILDAWKNNHQLPLLMCEIRHIDDPFLQRNNLINKKIFTSDLKFFKNDSLTVFKLLPEGCCMSFKRRKLAIIYREENGEVNILRAPLVEMGWTPDELKKWDEVLNNNQEFSVIYTITREVQSLYSYFGF